MDGVPPCPERPLSTADLINRITELAGHLNAGNYRWLVLIAEFDRRAGWNCGLTKSCAHWLNWKCGIDLGAAREEVRVAHALESLPLISAAMARGEVMDYGQAMMVLVQRAEKAGTFPRKRADAARE